ncbi:MAG: biopolymer transporter ExbD [Candidatus Binatia bacterium]
MRPSHRARSEESGLQQASIIPMINLVFLLLLYFLVTLSQRTQEGLLTTETPSGEGAVAQTTEEEVEEDTALVRIVRAADGVGLFFRDWPVAGYSDLARQLGSLPEETPIILEAAPDVPFRDVVRVHNLSIKTGHRNVVYTFPPA